MQWTLLICWRLQVEKAVHDGYDVRSFFAWTLIDNFEVCAALPHAPPLTAAPLPFACMHGQSMNAA